MSGYKIISEAPAIKREAVLKIEANCPVCSNNNNIKVIETQVGDSTYQNKYECSECGTVWQGNCYDSGWNPQKQNHMSKRIKNIFKIVMYLMLVYIITLNNVFLVIALAGLHFIACVALAIAGAIEQDKVQKNYFIKTALYVFIGNIFFVAMHFVF